MQSTYSFKDLVATFAHPAMGQLTITGEGVGSITYTMTEDTSAHDLAADGSVMTSKVEGPNGSIAIAVQQTSEAHAWFTRLNNYLRTAPAREWAQISHMATASDMRVTHVGENISIQKRPDKPYQAQGQQVTWTFLAGMLDER